MRTRWMLTAAVAVLAIGSPVSAQDHGGHAAHDGANADDVAAITAVVNTLFDGMRTGDSTMVRSVFHPEVRMVTSFRNREGQPQVGVEENLDGFVQMVGTPHDEVFDERISNLVVKVDGDFGMAWMDYSFFIGERFSHCGIDLMEMVRTADGWKIIHLADTRRRQGCADAPGAPASGS